MQNRKAKIQDRLRYDAILIALYRSRANQPMDLSSTIKARALAAGFDLAGIVSFDAVPRSFWDDLDFARRWVDGGRGGEMHYLANPKRDDPRRVLPSVRSVICVGLVYNAPFPYSTEAEEGSRQKAAGSRQEGVGSGRKAGSKKQKASGSDENSDLTSRVSNFEFRVSNRAWISRYAWGHDYHGIMRSTLERLRAEIESLVPGVETRVYVDTGPVVERALARYSGLGWMGKNTCLINQEKGSWFFLGVILTNLALAADLPAPDRCGSCTRCLEVCPTGALVEPYVMDASRCISYLTIELKGSIPPAFRSAVGRNVFGCDICQDVCPWNGGSGDHWLVASGELEDHTQVSTLGPQPRRAAITDRTEFQPIEVALPGVTEARVPPSQADGQSSKPATFSLFNPPLEALASLSEENFRQVFSASPIKRARYRGWLRNLCVAMGNSGSAQPIPWLERARQHPDPIVREHAEWALDRLQGTGYRE
jgi:epoxyqueuosine reductase